MARLGDPRLAVAYIRASKDAQKLTPSVQRRVIEAWAAHAGVHVAAWHVDHGVCSATDVAARPGLLAALAAVREHGAGFVVVAKRDRIARDVVVSAMAERAAVAAGAKLISADGTSNADTPEGAMMRGMVDVFAQYERAIIRQRTKAALAAKKARGERVGEVSYGYRLSADGVHVEPDAAEQAVIATVLSLSTSGLSVRRIAAELASRAVVGRTGRPLSHTQCHRIVTRAAAA